MTKHVIHTAPAKGFFQQHLHTGLYVHKRPSPLSSLLLERQKFTRDSAQAHTRTVGNRSSTWYGPSFSIPVQIAQVQAQLLCLSRSSGWIPGPLSIFTSHLFDSSSGLKFTAHSQLSHICPSFTPHLQVPWAREYRSLHTSDSSTQTKEPSYSPDSSDIQFPQLAAGSSWAVVHGPLQLSMWSHAFTHVSLEAVLGTCSLQYLGVEDTHSLRIWEFYFLLFYLLLFA